MIRGCPDNRKSGSIIDSFLESDSLERCETLIVVHCKHSIELAVVAKSEESIRRIWTECKDSFFIRSLYCRKDYLLLFISKQSAVAAVRVETQHRNLRRVDTEILSERITHDMQFSQYLFRRET